MNYFLLPVILPTVKKKTTKKPADQFVQSKIYFLPTVCLFTAQTYGNLYTGNNV